MHLAVLQAGLHVLRFGPHHSQLLQGLLRSRLQGNTRSMPLGALVSCLNIGCTAALPCMYCCSALPIYLHLLQGLLSSHGHHDTHLSISEDRCMPDCHRDACAAGMPARRVPRFWLTPLFSIYCPTACMPPPTPTPPSSDLVRA